MKELKLYTFIIFCMISVSVQAQNGSSVEEQIDSQFANFDNLEKPGAAIAVVQNGKIVFKKGYGSAQLEYTIPVTPSTVFHIASVSKQFTVFSILLLEAEGKLSFDDDIRKHIPEVPDFGKTITLRHLASHTSGLRDQWSLLSMAGWRWDDVITKEHILKLVSQQKELNFDPGEEYMYCNTGFTLLAEVVARVSGKSFAEFTEATIFKPLEMSSTLFYDDHEKVVKNRAYSYYEDGDTYKKSVLNYANVGATSLFTTVEDLSLWALNFSTLQVGSKNIISTMNTLVKLNDGNKFGGAYGQFVSPYKGLKQIQHGGADAGFRSYLARFPDQDFAVMVFSNLASSNPRNLALRVADLYLADSFKASATKVKKKSKKKFITLSNAELKAFEANYWNEEGAYARKMYVRNDTLRYSRGGQNESPLAPISKNKFQMLNVDVDLEVKFSKKDGKRSMVVTVDNDDPTVSHEFTPPSYTTGNLANFSGDYYSPELRTTYTLIVEKDQLVVKHPRVSDFNLTPVKTDLFSSQAGLISVQRDDSKAISGFRVTTGRVRNLWFKKLK